MFAWQDTGGEEAILVHYYRAAVKLLRTMFYSCTFVFYS